MKALIIAAGNGTRLRPYTNNKPKSLIDISDLTIIERVILAAKKAGIRNFVIITGYLEHKLRKFLGKGKKYGVKIKYVYNEKWKKPNGISVLKAKDVIQEKFVLLMADHIFDPNKLAAFKKLKIGKEECALCVDKNMHNIFDLVDATKVKVVDGFVQNIDKKLKNYNAIDTGMFLCTPYLFKVLEQNIKKGFCSLTDSVKTMAKQEKMRAYATNFPWADIDTSKDLAFAKRLIKSGGRNYGLFA
jgi:NDP-sugar pyrophosphorylase family protein